MYRLYKEQEKGYTLNDETIKELENEYNYNDQNIQGDICHGMELALNKLGYIYKNERL